MGNEFQTNRCRALILLIAGLCPGLLQIDLKLATQPSCGPGSLLSKAMSSPSMSAGLREGPVRLEPPVQMERRTMTAVIGLNSVKPD